MPNDQSHDPRVALPANRLAQAVALSVAAVSSGGGNEPLPDAGVYSSNLEAIYLALYPNYETWGAGDISNVSAWFYVDSAAPGGGDGSVGSPYTLAEAKALSLSPGQGLSFNPGTYSWTDVYTFTWSGTSGNPIYLKSTDLNNKAIINGGGTGKLLTSSNAYFGIYGLEITDTDGIGFGQGSNGASSNHLTVERCYFHDIDGPQGDNIACLRMDDVSESVFRNNLIVDITAVGGTSDGHAYETYRGFNNLFEHNEVTNTAKGFYVKIPTASANNGNIVRRNIFKDLRGDVFELAGNAGENQIHENNIFAENLAIRTGSVTDVSRELLLQPSGLFIINNTLIDAAFSIDGHAGVEFYNNIIDKLSGTSEANLLFTLRAGQANAVSEVSVFDYNCYPQEFAAFDSTASQTYANLSAWQSASNTGSALNLTPEGPDTNSFTTDPSFEDKPADDYRLAAGSPCIGAGKGGDNIGAYATQTSVIGRVA